MNKIQLYNSRFDIPAKRTYEKGVSLLVPKFDVKDKNKQVLDLIFGVDPNTGLPSGDLSQFVNDKVNPEVRLFIEQNLLIPRESNSGLSIDQDTVNKMNANLTDDDIAKFSRNHGESKEDYALRLKDYFEREKFERSRKREIARLKRIIDESE